MQAQISAPQFVTHAIGRDGRRRRREHHTSNLRHAQTVAARELKGFQTIQTRPVDDPMIPIIDAKWHRERGRS